MFLLYAKFSVNALYCKTTSLSVIREMQTKITTILAKIIIFGKTHHVVMNMSDWKADTLLVGCVYHYSYFKKQFGSISSEV